MTVDYKKKSISEILRSSKTVFTFKDIFLIWDNADKRTVISAVNYYVKTGQLYRIRRGIYARDKNYDRLELATKIFTPSYVSFETVLRQAGITFQYYETIFVAAYQSRDIVCDGQKFCFKRLKKEILLDNWGIENRGNYSIATCERAFLDAVYLYKNYHFDNLEPLDWQRIYEILPVYGGNKRMRKSVLGMEKSFNEE